MTYRDFLKSKIEELKAVRDQKNFV